MGRYLKLGKVVLGQLANLSVVIGPILLIVFLGMEGLGISVLLAWILVCPIACYRMAGAKGRSKGGAFALGLVLGVIGVLIVWFLPESVESRLRKEHDFRKEHGLDGD